MLNLPAPRAAISNSPAAKPRTSSYPPIIDKHAGLHVDENKCRHENQDVENRYDRSQQADEYEDSTDKLSRRCNGGGETRGWHSHVTEGRGRAGQCPFVKLLPTVSNENHAQCYPCQQQSDIVEHWIFSYRIQKCCRDR